MQLPFQRSYTKKQQRKILVISAGGEVSGIQGLYFVCHEGTWEIVSHTFIPYPRKIDSLIEHCRRQAVSVADISWLECKITQLFIECAKAVLMLAPRGLRKPDLALINQLALFKGTTGEEGQFGTWNLTIGDPQLFAGSFDVPVLSDFSRYSLLAGRDGGLPHLEGNLLIAQRYSGMVVLLNIGLLAHMTLLDRTLNRCILNADTGPGMYLINRCAIECGCPDGFDRDGLKAANGTVNADCLEELASSPWFMRKTTGDAFGEVFDPLLLKPGIMSLAPNDRLATITALTARTIYDFFKTHYKESVQPEAIVISGGGANNVSLLNYLTAYFGQVPVITCDKLGIPVDMRIPLALGLSVDSFLLGKNAATESGKKPAPYQIGRLSMP
jgi:anhydro-N-acetylmuramic acid kinase